MWLENSRRCLDSTWKFWFSRFPCKDATHAGLSSLTVWKDHHPSNSFIEVQSQSYSTLFVVDTTAYALTISVKPIHTQPCPSQWPFATTYLPARVTHDKFDLLRRLSLFFFDQGIDGYTSFWHSTEETGHYICRRLEVNGTGVIITSNICSPRLIHTFISSRQQYNPPGTHHTEKDVSGIDTWMGKHVSPPDTHRILEDLIGTGSWTVLWTSVGRWYLFYSVLSKCIHIIS